MKKSEDEYTYIALDLETTGLSPIDNRIIEIGAAKIVNGVIEDKFITFVNPQCHIPHFITDITGISDEDVENAPVFEDICGRLIEFLIGYPLLGHNIIMDYSMLKESFLRCGIKYSTEGIDTLKIAKSILPEAEKKSLEYLTEYLGIEVNAHHRAYDDAIAAYELYTILWKKAKEDNIYETDDIAKIFGSKELVYKVKKASPITPKQVRFLGALIADRNITVDRDIKSLTKSEASRAIDEILSGDFKGFK